MGCPSRSACSASSTPPSASSSSGAFTSIYPDLQSPLLTLEVYVGDLGLDEGAPVNVYALDTDDLTQVAGRDAELPGLELTPGARVDLPDGLGSIELSALPRFAALDVHRDPAQGFVLVFAALAVAGLLTSLFIARRRVWVKWVDGRLEFAGLARGEDPGLAGAVADIATALERPPRRAYSGLVTETLASFSLVLVYSALAVYLLAFAVFALDLGRRAVGTGAGRGARRRRRIQGPAPT